MLLLALQSYVSAQLHLQSSARQHTNKWSLPPRLMVIIKNMHQAFVSYSRCRWLCHPFFFLPKWKNESRQWGWSWQHGEKSWSLINNLKISTGFGVWGKPNSCRDECLLDAWCYFTRVHSIIFFYFNKEWMPSFLCRGAFLSNEPERVCLGICFKSHLVSARS